MGTPSLLWLSSPPQPKEETMECLRSPCTEHVHSRSLSQSTTGLEADSFSLVAHASGAATVSLGSSEWVVGFSLMCTCMQAVLHHGQGDPQLPRSDVRISRVQHTAHGVE